MNKTSSLHDIIFFCRAYNDFDTQLPLMLKFDEKGHRVNVIGIPCDGDAFNPKSHEMAKHIQQNTNINLTTIFEQFSAPFLLVFLFHISEFLKAIKLKRTWFLSKILHVSSLIILRKFLKRPLSWLDTQVQNLNADVIISDEAALQSGRSYIFDKIIPALTSNGASLFVIQTGQFVYKDIVNFGLMTEKKIINDDVKAFFVPSKLCQDIQQPIYPNCNFLINGNLRYDSDWISKITMIQRDEDQTKLVLSDGGQVKVLFMLSKMSYGVDEKALRKAIFDVARMPNVDCVVKPHTRGMKFDASEEGGEIFNAELVSSTKLIDWADVVLFTGSGIAFQAMALGKSVGYLSYCQNMETIFDDGSMCNAIQSSEELIDFINNLKLSDKDERSKRASQVSYFTKTVQNDAKNGKVTDLYINAINSLLKRQT